MDSLTELKAREERKRDKLWDPAERWRVLQATLTWADAQTTVQRNTPAACLRHQRELLARRVAESR